MALSELINTADASGQFGTAPAAVTSSVTIYITDDVVMKIEADKEIWAGGFLKYTIVITNKSTEIDYEAPAFKDILPAYMALVGGSVTVDDDDDPVYDETDNVLTMTLPTIEKDGGKCTVTFQVQKAVPAP